MAVQNEANMSEILSGVRSVSVDRVREVVDGAVLAASYMRDEMSAMRGRPEITRSEPEAAEQDAEFGKGLAASVVAEEAAVPESGSWNEPAPEPQEESYEAEEEAEESREADYPEF